MTTLLRSIDNFHSKRQGKLVFGILEIGVSTALFLVAVDTGIIWQYLLAIVLFIGGLRNIVNALHRRPTHGNRSKRK